MAVRTFYKIFIAAVLILPLSFFVPAFSQQAPLAPTGTANTSPGLTLLPTSVLGFNFLDRSRMSVSHQFMSVYSSASKGMSSLYFNTITYQVADPLTLKLHLGYAFQPMAGKTSAYTSANSSQVIPGFEMDYRPFGGKLNLHMGYNTPNYYQYHSYMPYYLMRAR